MSTLSCQRRRQGQHWRGIQLCGVRGRGSTGFVRHQSDQSEFVATVPVTDERLRSDLGGSRCARAQVWHSTNSRSFVCLTYGQASYPGSGTWPLRELFSATLFSELYWKSFWRASCSYAWLLGKFLVPQAQNQAMGYFWKFTIRWSYYLPYDLLLASQQSQKYFRYLSASIQV